MTTNTKKVIGVRFCGGDDSGKSGGGGTTPIGVFR